ncbi:MAG: squalene/phytoene synthase family protein, partial [Acidimicrobiales bacterium]
MARARAENFPVASRALPRRVRGHLLAVYGFARLADDIGDEAPGDRLAQLDWLASELRRSVAGEAAHPLVRRVGETIRSVGLPLAPFDDLLEANRQDQVVDRYERFDDLVAYCMRSAAPVGRLVLAIWGLATTERLALADRVCVGLQLAEHIGDVGEDARRGRIYLPLAALRAEGCEPADLLAVSAGRPLRRVVAGQVAEARRFLDAGPVLAATLPPRA